MKCNKCLRISCSFIYLIISLSTLYHANRITYFLNSLITFNTYLFSRFLWCVGSSFLGFAVLAFHTRNNESSPFPQYISYYPIVLIAFSSLIFAICFLSDKASGIIFYYLSFSVCFITAFYVDELYYLLTVWIINRGKK